MYIVSAKIKIFFFFSPHTYMRKLSAWIMQISNPEIWTHLNRLANSCFCFFSKGVFFVVLTKTEAEVTANTNKDTFFLTWAIIRVIKLHNYGVSIIGDINGGTQIIVQDNRTQAGVMGRLMRDDVNGRLPVSLGNGVVFMPRWRTLNSYMNKMSCKFTIQ